MTGGADIVSYSWNADGKELSKSDKYTVTEDLLGKTIYVIVTDSEGETAISDETAAVIGEAVVSEVKLDNITPAVGDKITASAFDEEGNDVSAQCTWQWFRVTAEGNVVKISNATKQSYTVGSIDTGAVLYCEATDVTGNLLKSNESSVMKQTNVTQINVNGMTGQRPGDKDEFVAIAGDELEVELVPYGAALDAEYQWYRGGAPIKGATEKTYIPTTADVKLPLSVKVSIPRTAGYGISEDATTTNANLKLGETYTGATYSLTGTVTLDDIVCWDLSNSTPVLDNTKPAVGDTITVKVPFDKNGDGDEKDTGDYLDLTSNTPDATVAWYRGSIEPKNLLLKPNGDSYGASYDVVKEDSGKALYAVVTGRTNTEFIGSCEATTDEANKTVMSTVISRETSTVTSTEDMDAGPAMTKGTKLYASTKDNSGASVKDANLTFQWYRGGAAIDGATSSSYTLGDDDIKKFTNATDHTVTYRVVVNGKDGYTGTAKDAINIKGAIDDTPTVETEDISVKRGDYYLHKTDTVNAGDELKLAASFADSLSALNVVWWYSAEGDGSDAEQFTGTSFTVPSTANMKSKIAVSVTLKDADKAGMWKKLNFATCTTNTTDDTKDNGEDKKKASSLTANLTNANGRVVHAGTFEKWTDLSGTANFGFLAGAKSLDSIAVTYKVADRTLTAPEVGATMTVSVQPQLANLSYKWEVDGEKVDSNDEDKLANGLDHGDGANSYTIKRADVNKKIKVTVTAVDGTAAYKGATISYESEAVAASSRTIGAIKVLKYEQAVKKGTATDTWYVKTTDENGKTDFLNDKADFVNKKSVSTIETNRMYIIVAMDSDGELIDSDVSYNLYDFKSGVEKKVASLQRFSGSKFKAGDVAHFEVAPNQVGYTGSAVSYNLSSAVKDAGEAEEPHKEISLKIAPTAETAVGNVDKDKKIVAQGGEVTFTTTVTGVTGSPSIKWFNGKGQQVGVGTTYKPNGLTKAGDVAFYAEMTVGGTTYASDAWEIQERALDLTKIPGTTIKVTTPGTGQPTTNTTSKFAFVDQFGAPIEITALSNKTLNIKDGSTGNATGTISVTVAGVPNVTMTTAGTGPAAGPETLTYTDTDNKLTWTVTGTTGDGGSAAVDWTISVAATTAG